MCPKSPPFFVTIGEWRKGDSLWKRLHCYLFLLWWYLFHLMSVRWHLELRRWYRGFPLREQPRLVRSIVTAILSMIISCWPSNCGTARRFCTHGQLLAMAWFPSPERWPWKVARHTNLRLKSWSTVPWNLARVVRVPAHRLRRLKINRRWHAWETNLRPYYGIALISRSFACHGLFRKWGILWNSAYIAHRWISLPMRFRKMHQLYFERSFIVWLL